MNNKKHIFSVPHLSGKFYVIRNDDGMKMSNNLFTAMTSGLKVGCGRDIKSAVRNAIKRLGGISQDQFNSALAAELTKSK